MSPAEGEQLFHATPRIVGTPMGSSNNNGPEKPLRQYAYEPHEVPPQVTTNLVNISSRLCEGHFMFCSVRPAKGPP